MEISVIFNLVCSRSLQVYIVHLDLTPPQMFQTPSMIVMSIAATRMYRSLSDIASGTEILDTYDILSFLCHLS
jgi:hypothetical protein